mmetsp:Transcript_2414/g.4875  ORF Transcript_2414/g.4875 Transcript_2414/m.4875 type:complete len:406 (-) Transcript_2414:243-1460(-)
MTHGKEPHAAPHNVALPLTHTLASDKHRRKRSTLHNSLPGPLKLERFDSRKALGVVVVASDPVKLVPRDGNPHAVEHLEPIVKLLALPVLLRTPRRPLKPRHRPPRHVRVANQGHDLPGALPPVLSQRPQALPVVLVEGTVPQHLDCPPPRDLELVDFLRVLLRQPRRVGALALCIADVYIGHLLVDLLLRVCLPLLVLPAQRDAVKVLELVLVALDPHLAVRLIHHVLHHALHAMKSLVAPEAHVADRHLLPQVVHQRRQVLHVLQKGHKEPVRRRHVLQIRRHVVPARVPVKERVSGRKLDRVLELPLHELLLRHVVDVHLLVLSHLAHPAAQPAPPARLPRARLGRLRGRGLLRPTLVFLGPLLCLCPSFAAQVLLLFASVIARVPRKRRHPLLKLLKADRR